MKKIYLFAALAITVVQAQAQDGVNLDTYMGAQVAIEDLNGTARYVGMGGAMEALGADISVMGSNPAGIGLFRKSQVSGSFGLVSQGDGKSFQDGAKTNASFDQLGIVFATRAGVHSYLNFGFNYHKSRNFNYVLSAANDAVNGSSLNRQVYIKAATGLLDTYNGATQLDQLIDDAFQDDMGNFYVNGGSYQMDRAHTGYIGEYDFNLSGNINNRVYLGMTVGLKDVHYNGYSEYVEHLASDDPALQYMKTTDDQHITGTGFNVKAGIIVRPVEDSPFRIGASVSSPTWYKLRNENYTALYDRDGQINNISYNVKFRFDTPWVFGLSLGHTIDNRIALGATYEYADYTTNDMRSIDDAYYDYWDDYYHENSSSDQVMKRHTERTLSGVSTLKLGAECKIDKTVAVRVGYNYVAPMYKESGVRDQTLDSPGTYMASTADYTNWKSTNRLTAGVGFTIDKFRLDLAYQYSMRSGDFYPFMQGDPDNPSQPFSTVDPADGVTRLSNSCQPTSVKDNRHQLLCTMTYTF